MKSARILVSTVAILAALAFAVPPSGLSQQSKAKPKQGAAPKKRAAQKKAAAPAKTQPVKPAKTLLGRDGAPMVFVPSGSFLMGSPQGQGNDDEHPQHQVVLDAFYIDQYEVTAARYEQFVKATGRTPPPPVIGDPPAITGWAGTVAAPLLRDKPVIAVSWEDAEAYCRWAGKRLPTEAEWEKAARGAKARVYPWGNQEPDAARANFGQRAWRTGEALASVGAYEAGKSPYGAYEMAGNLWEWVADWYAAAYYNASPARNPAGPELGSIKVIRGGSWVSSPRALRAANRDKGAHITRQINLGFRCAQPAK